MRYSKLFGKTQKNISLRFESKNHELLIKGGFIDQVGSGIFTILPLGQTVLAKIENIVREEMNKIGGQEVLMPSLHPKALWVQSNRFEGEDLFKVKSAWGQEYVLAGTHEEIVTPLVKKYIHSYKDLPLALYHITPKFRDEPRPKSGILRGREFRMKDLYSFHHTREDLAQYYKKVSDAYLRIFQRCGFDNVKITEASGGSFTKKLSHEFNILTPAGEVDLIFCPHCNFAQNIEVALVKTEDHCPSCKKSKLQASKAVEIGNIFDLGTRFSESFGLKFNDQTGKENFIIMGCYGIGTSRLLGALVEVHYDQKGIIWPKNVAPYQVHLIGIGLKDEENKNKIEEIYNELQSAGIEVLYDDRDISPGEKFADADLIGIPRRLVVSQKTGDKIEYKERSEKESRLMKLGEVINESS